MADEIKLEIWGPGDRLMYEVIQDDLGDEPGPRLIMSEAQAEQLRDLLNEKMPTRCVVGSCRDPRHDVRRVYYRGRPTASWLVLCRYHREIFTTRERSVLVEGWDVVSAQNGDE